MRKAVMWLKKAAELGSDYGQRNYGDLFMEGVKITVGTHTEVLVPKDIEQAKYWWKKAAAQGNEVAKDRLQKLYE
jgi:TPR repeat protein